MKPWHASALVVVAILVVSTLWLVKKFKDGRSGRQ